MKVHESFSDFVLFLYIHMALADGSFHRDEETVILDKLTKLFPHEGNPKKKLDDAIAAYHQFNLITLDEFVHQSFQHFSHIKFAQRYKVYIDMYDIIHADGKVDETEQIAMDALKKIIELSASDHA